LILKYYCLEDAGLSYCWLGLPKVSGFQTLRKKLMICGPQDPPRKFQLQIPSKSVRIKTRAEEGTQRKLLSLHFSALVLIRADLLRTWSWNFRGEFLVPPIINFALRVWNPLTFARPFVDWVHLQGSY
jgi:hypothetical protein